MLGIQIGFALGLLLILFNRCQVNGAKPANCLHGFIQLLLPLCFIGIGRQFSQHLFHIHLLLTQQLQHIISTDPVAFSIQPQIFQRFLLAA